MKIRDKKDKNLPERNITLSGLTMKVQYEKGELMKVDCSCDTAFMLQTVDEVGRSIREKIKWVKLRMV